MIEWSHNEGKSLKDLKLYALSTCGHCKTTRDFLNSLEVAYDYIYVDLLEEDELEKVYSEMKKYNPAGSFPTLVIDGKKVIIGSRLDEIRKEIGLDG